MALGVFRTGFFCASILYVFSLDTDIKLFIHRSLFVFSSLTHPLPSMTRVCTESGVKAEPIVLLWDRGAATLVSLPTEGSELPGWRGTAGSEVRAWRLVDPCNAVSAIPGFSGRDTEGKTSISGLCSAYHPVPMKTYRLKLPCTRGVAMELFPSLHPFFSSWAQCTTERRNATALNFLTPSGLQYSHEMPL